MTNQRSTIRVLASAVAALFALGAVPIHAQGNGHGNGRGPGHGQGSGGVLAAYIESLPLQSVDAVESRDLMHMRQEEKLARDVYTVLGRAWPIPAFANIARAEQEHMDLVKRILDRYGLQDPLPSNAVGVFGDQVFRDLFVLLTSFGQQSRLHAEIVGAVVEDLDLADLQVALARTDNRDIATVWQNLARGSRNHLRSFYGMLAARGLVYPGFFLSYSAIQAIVTTPYETVPVDENGAPLR